MDEMRANSSTKVHAKQQLTRLKSAPKKCSAADGIEYQQLTRNGTNSRPAFSKLFPGNTTQPIENVERYTLRYWGYTEVCHRRQKLSPRERRALSQAFQEPRAELLPLDATPFTLPACVATRYDLIVSLDTEYVLRAETGRNDILSYQTSAALHIAGLWIYTETLLFPAGPQDSDRLTLAEILAHVLDCFGTPASRADGLSVLLIAHFGVAEWAALRDRHALADHLLPVRGVPVCFKSFKLPVRYRDTAITLRIVWRDTYLLAPAGRRSLDALGTMTPFQKLELQADEKENMARLLAATPRRFVAYAANDPRVTLAYYLIFMQEFETLFGLSAEPLTLGDAAVRAFLYWLRAQPILSRDQVFGYERITTTGRKGQPIKRRIKTASRRFTEALATAAYMGGLNVAYTTGLHAQPDQLILDIDFAGAYPAALAVLPVIDWTQQRSGTSFRMAAQLAHAGCAIHDGAIPIAFVHCEFQFPQHCSYPCLPVQSPYGLLYPLAGVTTCTIPEVALATQLGADITILRADWFPPLLNETGAPVLAFADFLAMVTQRRAQEPKGSLRNLMLKECANSFYGKLAQGVIERNVYTLSGRRERLRPSQITTPHYAAMCTGIVRAALAAVVAEAAKHEGCTVLSATTDGCMLAIPRTFDVQTDDDGRVIPPAFPEVLPDLYARLKRHNPIQALEQGRLNMGLPPDSWLETKHVGDEALTLKTRGYFLKYKGITQHIARAGHQVKTADELVDLHEDAALPDVQIKSLASLRGIHSDEVKDLIAVETTRKANTDFDFKRIPLLDGTGRTRPPRTVDEVYAARRAARNIRQGGHRATPDAVALHQHGLTLHGGTAAAITRMIHRAIAQNQGKSRPHGMTDRSIAECLGITPDAFKQHKRRRFFPQSLPDTPAVRDLIDHEAAKLDADIADNLRRVLIAST